MATVEDKPDSSTTTSIVDQLKTMTQTNPSLARDLVTFLLDKTPDTNPVTKEEHPVFFDATKNPGTYHYVPKKGVGIQKDGTKLHAFDYEVSFHTRSKDFFGEDIDRQVADINEVRQASGALKDGDPDPAHANVCALNSIIVAAYSDLVINGNDDMTSYLYLCKQSVHALSPVVRDALDSLQYEGGVALGLVTELVATATSSEELFKRAVQPRDADPNITGIEALNEQAIAKAYAFLTPSQQTKGIMLNNGIDVNSTWATKLIGKAPTLDGLARMDYNDLETLLGPEAGTVDDQGGVITSGDKSIIQQMYAGMLGTPSSTVVPPVRKYLLQNNVSLDIANALEKQNHLDPGEMDDKQIYEAVAQIYLPPHKPNRIQGQTRLTSSLMSAKQSSMADKYKPNIYKPGKLGKSMPMGSLLRGGSKVAINGAGRAAASLAARGGATALAASGGAAGMAGMAASLAGPVGIALALAPVVASIASGIKDDNQRRVDEIIDSNRADRVQIESEVSDLLASIKDVELDEKLKNQEEKAKALLDKLRSSNSLASSKLKGIELSKELETLATTIGPTTMAALAPYKSDSELVAAVDSGRALTALALFVHDYEDLTTPRRQLLGTPKYVRMMGPSIPFRTRTHRTTSEKESIAFVTSCSHSGFSASEKNTKTRSSSGKVKGGGYFVRGHGSTSRANTTEEELTKTYANDKEHKHEEKVKVTQAVVTECTEMPMRAFCLAEGGLIMTDYAYHRLQKMRKDRDSTGEEGDASEAVMYQKARDFLVDFGSHIPFGVQTLGGVFMRTMKITTKEKTSLSTMYSSASEQLTKTNAEASKTTKEIGGSAGIFGNGASAGKSSSLATASMSGTTSTKTVGSGAGDKDQENDAHFESKVTCFGPNAATQDMLYDQLMNNNATWTIIDRGDPGSYFAIWDFIDYTGQGGLFHEECQLLKETWEGLALQNSGGDNEIMREIMTDYDVKANMFAFINSMISCLVPKNLGLFTGDLAKQFEKVMRAAAKAQASGEAKDDPKEFIYGGLAQLTEISEESLLFEIIDGNPWYEEARRLILDFRSEEWVSSFTYHAGPNFSNILEKGKPSYLVKMCESAMILNAENGAWNMVKALVNPSRLDNATALEKKAFARDLKRSLMFQDEESGRYCLHYIFHSRDNDLILKVFQGYPEVLELTDYQGLGPVQYALDNCNYSIDEIPGEISKESLNEIPINPPVDSFNVWLDGDSWDGVTWKDKSMNRNHPKTHGTVFKGTGVVGNNKVGYLYGGTSSGVTLESGWPGGKEYTFFHVTKYNGNTKRRIWTTCTTDENWLSGHWNGKRGMFHHGGWNTQCSTSVGDTLSWGIFTDRGSSNNRDCSVRVDGQDVTEKRNYYIPTGVAINHAQWSGETSDWAVAMVLVYDRRLSDDEVEAVENWIRTKYHIPVAYIDFSSDNSDKNSPYVLIGAQIMSGAPNGCSKALRISADKQHVKIPGIDISPSKMPNCSLVLAIYLLGTNRGMGYVVSQDNGGFDRSIALNDPRCGHKFGMVVNGQSQIFITSKSKAPTGKWLHIVAVFNLGETSYFYVNGEVSASGVENRADAALSGTPDLYLGQPKGYTGHYDNCWIKEVRCYNYALSALQVKRLYDSFDLK